MISKSIPLIFLLTLLFNSPQLVVAQIITSSVDSIDTKKHLSIEHVDYKFKLQQIITPAALLGVGIVGIYTFQDTKNEFQNILSSNKPQTRVDEYLQFVPAVSYLGLGFCSNIDRSHDFKNRLMTAATAYIVSTALTYGTKYAFQEKRPDGSSDDSFPSGHTARAFTGAELMRIEYGNLIGLAGYSIASATAFLRVYNNRHWINDIFAGAAIGIISARIAYWLLPLERKLFRLNNETRNDKSNRELILIPCVSPNNLSLSLALTF